MKAGYVSLIGRPNVGKSTLLNSLLGQKISIVSKKPQTTRNRIVGIKNLRGPTEGGCGQIVFLDTPGIQYGKKLLNQALKKRALTCLKGVDVVLHIIEPLSDDIRDENPIMAELRKIQVPILLAINKVDTLKNKSVLLPLMEGYHRIGLYREIIPISALRGDGLDRLQASLVNLCPEGERLFPEDMVTEETERFLVQEIIRESLFENTFEEIPYATAVTVESFEEQPEKNLIRIRAIIYVERSSQKGIVIGRRGSMLKKIGSQARREIEALLGSKVFLDLWVKIWEGWTDDPTALKDFGYI